MSRFSPVLSCAVLAAITACGTPSEPAPIAAPTPYVLNEAHTSVLARADAHDGTVDHVVSECAVCGLSMSGTPEHTTTVGDYKVQSCSTSCQAYFEENTADTLDRTDALLN